MEDCIFCKIIKGQIPCEKVYEDKHCFAFLDIKPINQGHILLVPKEHSKNIFEISESTLKNIIPALKNLASAAKTAMNADGINIGMNNEPAAGQAVMHTHFHIIPRFNNDELKHWPGKDTSKEELSATAERMRKLN
jgi:histidine triad (HIT) family protein